MIVGIASADYLRADRSGDGKEYWGGSGWARVGQYVEGWRAAGHTVVVGTAWRNETGMSVEDAEGNMVFPDIVIMQRLMHDGLDEASKLAIAAGQIVINDLDDWYWGLDTRNEAFIASHPKFSNEENRTFYKHTLASSSLVTVSTPYLAERIKAWVKCPIVVMPNYINVSRFVPVTPSKSDCPEVGWVGSTGHRSGDLELMRGILQPLVRDGKITVYHGGDSIGYPTFASLAGVEPVRTASRTTADDYPKLMQFDVGIVPLRDTPFNQAKSDIKGLEYAASGIPFVASDLPSYRNLRDRYEIGLLAKKPNEWVRHLNHLRDPGYRRELAIQGLENVQARDIKYGLTETLSLLEGLL